MEHRELDRVDAGGESPDGAGPAGLSAAQRTAIEWLTAGESAVSAAAAAGVNRTTVYRWLKADPAFQAAYNAWQSDVLATARARLLALTDAAVTTVTAAVARGDARTALAVLQRQGLLAPPQPGPTDPELIAREREVARRRAEVRVAREEEEAMITLPM